MVLKYLQKAKQKLGGVLVFALLSTFVAGQQEPPQDWLEEWQPSDESLTEDDAGWLELERLRRHPVSLNSASAEELQQIPFLSALHIAQLVLYRQQMGPLLHVHELQAVPAWSTDLIRRILPFTTISDTWKKQANRENWLKDGTSTFLLRYSRKWSADETPAPSPFRMFVRYRYAFLNRIQWGVVADKDAGEPIFGPVQKAGFDFYSLHAFVRLPGKLRELALGDFTINMGQGLIHWQRMGFGKAADLASVKQQAPTLAPYQSAGEFAFHRGVGWKLDFGRLQWTGFISKRKLSATVIFDSAQRATAVSAIRTSGLHVTSGEQAGRNMLDQTCAGAVVRYVQENWKLAANFITHHFRLPLQPQERPDNKYAVAGTHWWNASVDYAYTWKNLHFFGELALAPNGAIASTQAILISLASTLDLAVHRRDFSIRYRAVAAQTFSERSSPGNEHGLFWSLDWKPASGWRLRAFADHFFIPWITATSDQPVRGGDYWWQIGYQVRKSWELTLRWRASWDEAFAVSGQGLVSRRQGWRAQLQIRMNGNIEWRTRVEMLKQAPPSGRVEHGLGWYTELIYRPMTSSWEGSVRVLYFNTDSYSSRIYAYERDVLYFSSIPAFYGQGWRYYLIVKKNLGKRLKLGMRWAQTLSAEPPEATDKLVKASSELRLQFMYDF